MTINRIAARAIITTALSGLILVASFALALAKLEQRHATVSRESSAAADLLRLQDALKQWTLLGDLVFGSGETYLIAGAEAQGDLIKQLLAQLRTHPFVADKVAVVSELSLLMETNSDALQQPAVGRAEARGGPNDLLAAWDERSSRAVVLFEQMDTTFRQASELALLNYSRSRQLVMQAALVGTLLYIVILAWNWRYLHHQLARPLRHITRAAEAALRTGEPLHVAETGPAEIRDLSRSANRLTQLLEERVQNRTTALSQEIDVRRAAEAEAERGRVLAEAGNRAKSEFIANVSHEFRTPLNGVMGMSQLLDLTELSDRQRHYVTVIRNSATSLLDLINDVLEFSKAENGGLHVDPAEFELESLCADALSQVEAAARQKSLQLRLALQPDIPRTLVGDAKRLRQILLNLLGNAVKFTNAGSVLLTVTSTGSNDGNVPLQFAVTDTGIGVRPENLQAIFDSFVQEDSSTTRRFGGTGLGLAISKRLVQAMGGEIGVSSEPGAGSRFWFQLTLRQPESNSSPRLESQSGVDQANTTPLSVLVVEDNTVNQFVAKNMLEQLGCVVTLASDGFAALQSTDTRRFDVILMDWQMPGLDGFETTARIRQREKDRHQPPRRIVGVTANAMVGDREQCLAASMDDYLAKPYTLDQLRAVLLSASSQPSVGGRDDSTLRRAS